MEDDRDKLEEDYKKTLEIISEQLTTLHIQRLTNHFFKISPRDAQKIEKSDDPADRLWKILQDKGLLSSTNVDLLIENLEFLKLMKAADILKRYKNRNISLIKAEIERVRQEQLRTSPRTTSPPSSQDTEGKMPGKGMQNKIFISFSFSVEKKVTELKNKIESELGSGSCWICTSEVWVGDDLSKELTKAINGADVMLCMINQKYIDSEMCEEEFCLAKKLGKKIILVHLEKMTWPYKKSNGEDSPMQLAATKQIYLPLYKENKKEELNKLIYQLKVLFGEDRKIDASGEETATASSSGTTSTVKRKSQDQGEETATTSSSGTTSTVKRKSQDQGEETATTSSSGTTSTVKPKSQDQDDCDSKKIKKE